MKKLILLAILTAFTAVSCVEESECYKCELISADGRFSTTKYLPCSTDIEHYKASVYERGRVSSVKCEEL